MKPEIPKVRFRVSRLMNQFCHISVLYPEFLHPELSNGMLANMEYRKQNVQHRRPEIAEKLGKAGVISPGLWYSFSRVLMNADSVDDIQPSQGQGSGTVGLLLNVLDHSQSEYGEVWRDVRPRLEKYTENFSAQWSLVGHRVLSRLSGLVNRNWDAEEIVVCFVECLYGGFGWVDSIGLTPVAEMDVGKKLLTHELSELITPTSTIVQVLRSAGLEEEGGTYGRSPAHTVVDMLAYFSVKDYLNDPGRKGMKPNPGYYTCVEALYPLFEAYSEDPAKYRDFEQLAQDVVLTLKQR